MLDTWKSKKLWFGVGAICAMFGFALVSSLWIPAMVPLFDGFVGGVVGVTGIVIAGNVANKMAIAKMPASVQQQLTVTGSLGPPVEPGPEDNQ